MTLCWRFCNAQVFTPEQVRMIRIICPENRIKTSRES